MSKIICHCAGVTEDDIRTAVRKGDDTVEKLKESLHVATTCRFCIPEIEQIIYSEKHKI